MFKFFTAAAAVAALSGATALAETGDLKIRFEYDGERPQPKAVLVNKDVEFCGNTKLADERLIVSKENNGIKNVVVYVYTGRGGSKLDDVEPANNTHTLANDKCRFEPHVLIAQKGDTIKVTNPDEVAHNANFTFFNNASQNFTIPAGQSKDIELKEDEPGLSPVACNIHPWMKAFLLVLDHPYGGVTDENGEVVIKGLPTGELVFRVNHEAGAIREVMIDGKKESWRGSRFEVEIKPGMNDLGTIMVPADALSSN